MDVTERLRRHIEYKRERDIWARRAIKFLAEGDDEGAELATELAERWDLELKALEPDSGVTEISPSPDRGRD